MKWLLITTTLLINTYNYAQNMITNDPLPKRVIYQVEWLGERPLIDASYLNLVLDNDHKAYGLAGCNYWSSTYQLTGHQISFDKALKKTKQTCSPALMEQEQRFLTALVTVVRWDFSELGQLRLWPKQGQPIRLWQENRQANAGN